MPNIIREYDCAKCGEHCHVTDEDDWTEEDARKEAIENGFDPDASDMAVICDVCYKEMEGFIKRWVS